MQFVYLKGSFDLIWERMLRRQNHYMKASMLQSQFAALEEPEGVLTCDITPPPEQIVDDNRRRAWAGQLASTPPADSTP